MFALACAATIAGCSGGGDDFGSLYEAPTGSSTGSLMGVWGGLLDGLDTRWVLEPDQVTLANKCGSKIVGVAVAAQVDDSQIRVLESGHDGNDSCWVNVAPGTFTVCSTDPFEPKENCFAHDNLQLTIYATDVSYVELTKIED